MAQPQLSPDMAQPAMNQFLAAAFGVQTNPFSVKDIFESRKEAVAWGLLERTLKLDDKQAHDLYSNNICISYILCSKGGMYVSVHSSSSIPGQGVCRHVCSKCVSPPAY